VKDLDNVESSLTGSERASRVFWALIESLSWSAIVAVALVSVWALLLAVDFVGQGPWIFVALVILAVFVGGMAYYEQSAHRKGDSR
jgi:hypothetical protein